MFQTKVVQKIKTHTLCSVTFFFLENRAVYENMWENNVEPGTPQMTIRRMRIACSIHKATNTHSEYVILIAFPLQPWLTERASVLLYTLPLLFYWVWVKNFVFYPVRRPPRFWFLRNGIPRLARTIN